MYIIRYFHLFRRERINGEAQNESYCRLHHRGGVKEKDLRFGIVNAGARSFREVVEKRFEEGGFLYRRVTKQHVIINKLLMGYGWGAVDGETFQLVRDEGMFDVSTQTFCH